MVVNPAYAALFAEECTSTENRAMAGHALKSIVTGICALAPERLVPRDAGNFALTKGGVAQAVPNTCVMPMDDRLVSALTPGPALLSWMVQTRALASPALLTILAINCGT